MSDTPKQPFEKTLSENVVVRYGWKDGHAIVRVKLPLPFRPWYSVEVPVEAISKFKTHFEVAHARTTKEVVEFEAREDCRGRYGYEDGHVELGVKRGVWIWINFTWEEFKLAKAAMDEAHAWAALPLEIRDLQGITV